jgi:hypothetical protein
MRLSSGTPEGERGTGTGDERQQVAGRVRQRPKSLSVKVVTLFVVLATEYRYLCPKKHRDGTPESLWESRSRGRKEGARQFSPFEHFFHVTH